MMRAGNVVMVAQQLMERLLRDVPAPKSASSVAAEAERGRPSIRDSSPKLSPAWSRVSTFSSPLADRVKILMDPDKMT